MLDELSRRTRVKSVVKRCKAMAGVKQTSATPNESIQFWNRSEPSHSALKQ